MYKYKKCPLDLLYYTFKIIKYTLILKDLERSYLMSKYSYIKIHIAVFLLKQKLLKLQMSK